MVEDVDEDVLVVGAGPVFDPHQFESTGVALADQADVAVEGYDLPGLGGDLAPDQVAHLHGDQRRSAGQVHLLVNDQGLVLLLDVLELPDQHVEVAGDVVLFALL